MNVLQKVIALREGGQTMRAHTRPYLGYYDVAMHSYNATNLLFMLYPKEPSMDLVKAVMWHDIAERWTGDTPAPAKWASKLLKSLLDSLEEQVYEQLGLLEPFKNLTEDELNWLSAVDLLELYIWSKEQKAMGNSNAEYMTRRIIKLFEERGHKTPTEVTKFFHEFKLIQLEECDILLGGKNAKSKRQASGRKSLSKK